MALIIILLFSLLLQGSLGEIICEELPEAMCSFSIASSGKRCVLENHASGEGKNIEFQCITSEVVVVENLVEWIERDECINACGVDRKSVGISSDSLLDPHFTANLCSVPCYRNCPNIIDLYTNLAIGEGVHLPDLCNKQRLTMSQLLSSDAAAYGPISSSAAASDGPISSSAADGSISSSAADGPAPRFSEPAVAFAPAPM